MMNRFRKWLYKPKVSLPSVQLINTHQIALLLSECVFKPSEYLRQYLGHHMMWAAYLDSILGRRIMQAVYINILLASHDVICLP